MKKPIDQQILMLESHINIYFKNNRNLSDFDLKVKRLLELYKNKNSNLIQKTDEV